ncbi:hypothetical protein ES708_23019 [subsurface metagenome]
MMPTTVRCFLGFIWVFKEARPEDVDKKPQFAPGPFGTVMEYKGRRFRYFKADRNYKKGEVVKEADHE